jgi:hypothetical protein
MPDPRPSFPARRGTRNTPPAAAEATGAPGGGPIPVSVWTMWRGAEIIGNGMLSLAGDVVAIEVSAVDYRARPTRIDIPVTSLDGVRPDPDLLTLYPHSGDVVELSPGAGKVAALAAFGRQLIAVGCVIPELTVPLKGFGSSRASPGADHDRFFAALLTGRTAAARAAEPMGRLGAVDPAALDASLTRVTREMAAARFPKQPPERRALEAELSDLAEPVATSIGALAEAARAVREAPDDQVFVRWRAWASAYRAVFAAADRCWLATVPVLAAAERR